MVFKPVMRTQGRNVVYGAVNRERQSLGKTNKKLDKRLKEFTLQYDEERRSANQYKEQVRTTLKMYCVYIITTPTAAEVTVAIVRPCMCV